MRKILLIMTLILSLLYQNEFVVYAETSETILHYATRGEIAYFIVSNIELEFTGIDIKANDIEGHIYEDSIVEALNAELLYLYEDGSFRPNGNIRRGEFAYVLVSMLSKMGYDLRDTTISQTSVVDIDNHWAEPYVNVLINLNIFIPDEIGRVYPDDNLTNDYLNNDMFSNLDKYKLTNNIIMGSYEFNVDYNKSETIRVFVEEKEVKFDVSPQLINGRTLVPMRLIFEKIGLDVEWDNEYQSAKGTRKDNLIIFTIGNDKAIVNNKEVTMDVPAMIINNRTMVPLRFLSENIGYNVVWVGESNIILMSKSNIVEWRYGGYENIEPYKEYELKYVNGVNMDEIRYNGKNHDVKVEWKNAGYELVKPYKEYEIKFVDGIETSEIRYTGKTKPQAVKYKKIDYSWEYPYGWITWKYSLNIPVEAVNIYKSIDRKNIFGYSYYVTHEEDDEYMNALANVFINTVKEEGYSDWDLINLAVSFVQSLKYVPDKIGTGYDEYPKFPLETLYDQGGDCEDSSILLASILRELGYGTVLVMTEDHMGFGLKTSDLGNFKYMEMNFYYIETSSTGWDIGELPSELEGEKITILPVN